MAGDFHKGDAITADSENPRHHHNYLRRGIKQADNGGVDLISSLPDEIIQHILSFIQAKFAIRTSVLSRRWRHICWGTPSIYFDNSISTTELINKTLIRYTATKFISIHIHTKQIDNAAQIDSWIEFAMSRKVEKLSLGFHFAGFPKYTFPDFLYSSSSLKQLSLYFGNCFVTPICTVSWTSLKNLSFGFCNLPDESVAQILSGCPVLESLSLTSCRQLGYLDLSKSLRLRRLDITCFDYDTRSVVIIAPHIYYLRLRMQPSTLVDVSSLTEGALSFWHLSLLSLTNSLVFVQNMLAKLHNVKKLTLEANFLQILSCAEHNGCLAFPTFKVEDLTLEINIFRSVLTGITKVLQNSPGLKKITVHITKITQGRLLFDVLDSKGLNEYQLWRDDGIFQTPLDTIPMLMNMEVEAKFVFWLVESLLRNTKAVKTIVVLLGNQFSERGFNELLQMVPTLHSKVCIVLKQSYN